MTKQQGEGLQPSGKANSVVVSAHTLVILIGAAMTLLVAMVVLLLYYSRRKGEALPKGKRAFTRLGRQVLSEESTVSSARDKVNPERSAKTEPSAGQLRATGTVTGLPDVGESRMRPLEVLYGKMGKRQKVAGLVFVIASISFLLLSVPFNSIVLEVDSVVSFVVAAVLFLKENRNRVQSRVLNAVVSSLGATIAELSSRVGSRFVYAPVGRKISDVAVVDSPDDPPTDSVGASLKVVPPGMGLAELFAREAEGISITTESLEQLLPSMISDNFGLAEDVEVTTTDDRVEILLRQPRVVCSCQKDESRSSGVFGCTVSSFLAVLYCHGSQRVLSLDRCTTDQETRTWKISMSMEKSSQRQPSNRRHQAKAT